VQVFLRLHREKDKPFHLAVSWIVTVDPREGGATLALAVPGTAGKMTTIDVIESDEAVLRQLDGYADILAR
jgi:hypothetical protein